MQICRDPEEFFRLNHREILKLLRYKMGSFVMEEVVQDKAIDFYIEMIERKTLDKYDQTKGSFDNYICTALYWTVVHNKRYDRISKDMAEEMDTADIIGEQERLAYEQIGDFKRWIIRRGGNKVLLLLELLQNRMSGTLDCRHPATKDYNALLEEYRLASSFLGRTGIQPSSSLGS